MLKINTSYELYINGELFDNEIEIMGAVGDTAVAFVRGNAYNFHRETGRGLTDTRMELRSPYEPDIAAIRAYVNNLSANAYNEKLSDTDFREYARTVINLLIDEV